MVYDRASWHYGGNFPNALAHENAATHIGMFLAWVIVNFLESEDHKVDTLLSLIAVRSRRMTGREFLLRECDGVLSEEDLNDEANAFAQHYYSQPDQIYLADYQRALADKLPSSYHVEDTWGNYAKIAPIISERFLKWKQCRRAPTQVSQRTGRSNGS